MRIDYSDNIMVYTSWTHNADYRTQDVVAKTKSLMRKEQEQELELEQPSESGELEAGKGRN